MRNYKYYTLALVLLIVAIFLFFFSNSSGNLNPRNSQFSVENTSKVLEIRIIDEKNRVILTKENSQWKVNNKFLVKDEIIANFLQAINRLEILYPVSKIDKSQITNLLKREGVLVEIKKNRFKTNTTFFC